MIGVAASYACCLGSATRRLGCHPACSEVARPVACGVIPFDWVGTPGGAARYAQCSIRGATREAGVAAPTASLHTEYVVPQPQRAALGRAFSCVSRTHDPRRSPWWRGVS